MHEGGGVRGVQRRGHLPDDRRGASRLERPLAPDQRVEVRPPHVAHGEVQLTVLLAHRVHRHHVGMLDRGGHALLPLEALAELGIGGPIGRDELERHDAPAVELHGAVDDAHAPATGDRLDAVAAEHVAWRQRGHRPILTDAPRCLRTTQAGCDGRDLFRTQRPLACETGAREQGAIDAGLHAT